MTTAEREELLRQRRRPRSGLDDLLEIVTLRLVGRRVQRESGITHDRGQQIVEVVRDSSGQLSERFHLLRLSELKLQGTPFRDVRDDTDHSRRLAVSVRDNASPELKPTQSIARGL